MLYLWIKFPVVSIAIDQLAPTNVHLDDEGTSYRRASHVSFWHKVDVPEPPINVRFWGNSGHQNETAEL